MTSVYANNDTISIDRVTNVSARRSKIFVHAIIIASVLLQRFGVTIGGGKIFLSLPVFVFFIGFLVICGLANAKPGNILRYGVMAVSLLLSTIFALNFPDLRSSISIASLIAMLLNYSIFIFSPSDAFDRKQVLKIFIFYARICAVAGIAQYLVQFVGIRIFSFTKSFPILEPVLMEKNFNTYAVSAYGSTIVRSNGFFFLEPSYFSQFLVIAISIEFFILRHFKFLPIYALAYFFSFSGTGLISLIIALPIYVFVGARDRARIISLAIAGLLCAAIFVAAFPEKSAALMGRSTEIQRSGTSGNRRFLGQFEMMGVIAGETRSLVGLGPGAMDRANFLLNGTGSPIMKLFIDDGWLGLLVFLIFFIGAICQASSGILPILLLVVFQFGGGNLVLSPILAWIALLAIWAQPPKALQT